MSSPFAEFLDEVRPTINGHMKQILYNSGMDKDVIKMLLKGKRLRAGVLCAVFNASRNMNADPPFDAVNRMEGNYNGTDLSFPILTDEVLDLACAIELAHAASLIVDDMIDEDETRRGEKTRHLTKGYKTAMLESIGLLAIPYDLAGNHGKFYVKSLSKTQKNMVLGAIKELFSSPDLPASKLHDMIITQKTGRLFALSAQWGSIAAGYLPDGDSVKTFTKFGLHCGKAMQIADDIVDLNEIAAGGKKSGFGSEVLLLNCIGIDGLIKEFVTDFNRCDLNFGKISRSRTAIRAALHDKSFMAVKTAVKCLGKLPEETIIDAGGKELLEDIPCAIAKMMFDE